jgi:hypothetical protein
VTLREQARQLVAEVNELHARAAQLPPHKARPVRRRADRASRRLLDLNTELRAQGGRPELGRD